MAEQSAETEKRLDKVVKSDAEWKEQLSPEAYRVTRQHATERPWTHDDFPNRPGTIRMELRRLDGRRVELSIADDGVGFDPEEVPATSSGLQIVHALVRQIEGELETRSGSGTEHRIVFPAP